MCRPQGKARLGRIRDLVTQNTLETNQAVALPGQQAPQAKPADNPHQDHRPAVPDADMDQVIARAIKRDGINRHHVAKIQIVGQVALM